MFKCKGLFKILFMGIVGFIDLLLCCNIIWILWVCFFCVFCLLYLVKYLWLLSIILLVFVGIVLINNLVSNDFFVWFLLIMVMVFLCLMVKDIGFNWNIFGFFN